MFILILILKNSLKYIAILFESCPKRVNCERQRGNLAFWEWGIGKSFGAFIYSLIFHRIAIEGKKPELLSNNIFDGITAYPLSYFISYSETVPKNNNFWLFKKANLKLGIISYSLPKYTKSENVNFCLKIVL
jgi:hypothetical protein